MKPNLPTKRSLTRRLKPVVEKSRVLKFGIKGLIASRATWSERLSRASQLVRARRSPRS